MPQPKVARILGTLIAASALAWAGAQPACAAPTEGAALLWHMNHGGVMPRMPPAPGVDWRVYVDPVLPLISFAYPPGWQVVTSTTGYYYVGATLLRADGGALFDIRQFDVGPGWGALQVAYQGLQDLIGAPIEALCTSVYPAAGVIPTENGVLVARSGGLIAFAATQVFHMAGMQRADIRAVVAPVAEFDAVTWNVVLPVYAQMLVSDPDKLGKRNNSSNGNNDDRDGDGTPDDADNFPDDPNRQ